MSVLESADRMSAAKGPPTLLDSHGHKYSSFLANIVSAARGLLRSIKIQSRTRSLRLCETLPLGEKRFLAIVQVEQRRFLIATTNQSISLLRTLDDSDQPQQSQPEAFSDCHQDGIS